MNLPVYRLSARDIPAAMELSCAAGWNQTAEDWRALLELDPEGCLGLACDGRLVATTTLVCHDSRLAWLGMVLTHREYQRRGFARRLVEEALALADARKIETVKLDATDAGQHLYEILGFREEQEIQRWVGTGAAATLSGAGDHPPIAPLDREAFGADRSRFLELLSRRVEPVGDENGFVLWRPGYRASYIGPCVARTPEAARSLVERRLGAGEQPWYWDVFPANAAAVSLATEMGFQAVRKLLRMVRGASLSGDDSMVYAGAGFEIG
jgi:GNAT superfamily N-acetyltransferase